jgi:hypothetical protein
MMNRRIMLPPPPARVIGTGEREVSQGAEPDAG